MRKSLIGLIVFAVGSLILYQPTAAYAQATRTWVSGVGDDANPCSRTAPCKTWAGAIAKTAAGGEIDALDPGGFGAVTITQSITLDGGGGQVASVLVAGTNGIVVNAAATDIVTLRNLRFNGLACATSGCTGSPGLNGISMAGNGAGTLIVANCDIFGFANNGIWVDPSVNAKVLISKTTINNTATATGNAAILIEPFAQANANVTINDVSMQNQINGVFVNGASAGIVHVQIRDSVITGSTNNGVTVSAANGGADVINTLISYSNNIGAVVGSGTLKLGGNTITNNVTGVSAAGGTLQSFKDNRITDNGTDGTPIAAVPGNSGTLQ
jgi:hypothetical protein